jgi:hypothetical protein
MASSNPLAAAQAAVNKANKLQSEVNKVAPPPSPDYSKAPYSMVPAARKKTAGEDIAAGLAEREKNVKAYTEATK